MSKAKTIVRLVSFANRTPTGRPSATAVKRLARYCALGRGTKAEQSQRELRGSWYSEAGKPVSHEATLAWVHEQGKRHPFTHQFILSAKEVTLAPAEYCQAMHAGGELFRQWRLIAHTDADFAHAHAIAFSDEEMRIKSAEFQAWWQAVRSELERLQDNHLLQQQEQALAAISLQELAPESAPVEPRASQLEEAPEQRRGWSLEV
jgi:hypothetical protein